MSLSARASRLLIAAIVAAIATIGLLEGPLKGDRQNGRPPAGLEPAGEGPAVQPGGEENAGTDGGSQGESGLTTSGPVVANVVVRSFGEVVFEGDVSLVATIEGITSGRVVRRDTFQNRERLLPARPAGYYSEYVQPTPGIDGAGPQRIVLGKGGEIYYTPDHYASFIEIVRE